MLGKVVSLMRGTKHAHRIHVILVYLPTFYYKNHHKNVGKYTVRPMDPYKRNWTVMNGRLQPQTRYNLDVSKNRGILPPKMDGEKK